MATLEEINIIKNDATLRSRIESAMDKSAVEILNEDGATANHAERVLWAKDVLYSDVDMVDKMMGLFTQNATLQADGNDSTDNDIQFIVNSYIDQFAINFYV